MDVGARHSLHSSLTSMACNANRFQPPLLEVKGPIKREGK